MVSLRSSRDNTVDALTLCTDATSTLQLRLLTVRGLGINAPLDMLLYQKKRTMRFQKRKQASKVGEHQTRIPCYTRTPQAENIRKFQVRRLNSPKTNTHTRPSAQLLQALLD
jgi:hypothetical protein